MDVENIRWHQNSKDQNFIAVEKSFCGKDEIWGVWQRSHIVIREKQFPPDSHPTFLCLVFTSQVDWILLFWHIIRCRLHYI